MTRIRGAYRPKNLFYDITQPQGHFHDKHLKYLVVYCELFPETCILDIRNSPMFTSFYPSLIKNTNQSDFFSKLHLFNNPVSPVQSFEVKLYT